VKHCHSARTFLAAPFLLVGLCAFARADNWPQWRGLDNNGISKEKNLPTEWDESKNVVWKIKMPGWAGSTPAVWGDHIFLTADDGKELALVCVSTKGEELWKKKVGNSDGKRFNKDGNYASPSPSTDGTHVYCYFGTGDLACFNFDGKEIWKADIQARYGRFKIQWGMHTSPLLYGDRLYLQLLHSNGNKVVALDKSNGEEVWKIDRKSDGTGECEQAYASPSIGKNGKDEYLIVHGNDYTTAHSLKDGAEIWRVGDLNFDKEHYRRDFRFVSSPVASADLIVVPTCKNGPLVAVKPDSTGSFGAGGKGELWRLKQSTPDVPSPLIVDGLVYLAPDGHFTCLDGKTGKEYYREATRTGIHRASPVYADGKIYVAAEEGTVVVVKAGSKFEMLAKNKLPDTITASPVIADGRIYIRGWDNLYAISQNGK
jgi:outer membrane protein assembly factor BamB